MATIKAIEAQTVSVQVSDCPRLRLSHKESLNDCMLTFCRYTKYSLGRSLSTCAPSSRSWWKTVLMQRRQVLVRIASVLFFSTPPTLSC